MTDEIEVTKTCQDAKDELASNVTPAPDDLLDGLHPFTQLWFTREVTAELLIKLATVLDPEEDEVEGLAQTVGVAIQAVAQATGMLNAACVAVGLLPEGVTA